MPLHVAHECHVPYVQKEVNRSFVESCLLSWGFDLYCLHRRIIIHKNLCFQRVIACVNLCLCLFRIQTVHNYTEACILHVRSHVNSCSFIMQTNTRRLCFDY